MHTHPYPTSLCKNIGQTISLIYTKNQTKLFVIKNVALTVVGQNCGHSPRGGGGGVIGSKLALLLL